MSRPDNLDASLQLAVVLPANGRTAPTLAAYLANNAIFNVKDYGAVGDGRDDTEAITAAKTAAGTNGIVWYPPAIYQCASKITCDIAGQLHYGPGATLLFDVMNTTRLVDVTASNVTFAGLTFDGNLRQPSLSLVAVTDNAARAKFLDCTFKRLTGSTAGSNELNQMYALMISPYGVADFKVSRCVFMDILKHNDTATVITPTVGWGFCGGILFYNGSDPAAVQTVVTSGVIAECAFSNIRTILNSGLSVNDQSIYDDADGIRFYGNATGANRFPIVVRDCQFRQVSKRAIKQGGGGTTTGLVVENVKVDGSGLPYPMISVVKPDNDSTYRSVHFRAESTAMRVHNMVEINGHENITLEDFRCDYCTVGVSVAPISATVILKNVRLLHSMFEDCTHFGYVLTGTQPASQKELVLDDVVIRMSGNIGEGINVGSAADSTCGVILRAVRIENGSVYCSGHGSDIDGLTVIVTSGTYAGPGSTRHLVTLGLPRGLGTKLNVFKNVLIDARGIVTSWNTANRSIALVYGDRQRVTNFQVRVPDAMGTGGPEVQIAGDDLDWNGVTYEGPGYFTIGTADITVNGIFRQLTRVGTATTASSFFIINNMNTARVSLEQVVETTAPGPYSVIRLLAGGPYLVRDVTTRSTSSPVVEHAAVVADVAGVRRWGSAIVIVPSAATLSLPFDGPPVYHVSGTTNITSITAINWNGKTVTLVFQGALTVLDGSNLFLAGNFVATADDSITLTCIGANWYEQSRSTN
jgi:hypothetical protein